MRSFCCFLSCWRPGSLLSATHNRGGFPIPARCSCGPSVEGDDADEVVHGASHQEPRPVPLPALVAQLAATTDGLGPSEGLLDPLADPLTDGMTPMPGGAPVDPAA